MPLIRWRCFCLATLVAVAGCATSGLPPPGPVVSPGELPPGSSPQYDVVGNRTAETVARLRTMPPPDQPLISESRNRVGDERVLRERGLVKIGISRFQAADKDQAQMLAGQLAVRHGAEEVRLYAPRVVAGSATSSQWIADFYVRLQLPFGADFRDLTGAERKRLGTSGVEIGEVIGETPASAANLRRGDFVLKLDQHAIRDRADFQAQLGRHLGSNVTLTIRRGDVTFKRLVQLGTLPDDSNR